MKKKIMLTAIFLCIGILSVPLGGCKKKDDESTAIAITPTPSDKSDDEPTMTPVPTISANGTAGISSNTSSPAGISGNSGVSANAAGNGNKITGTIVAASMNDVTVRTSEGTEYVCSTTGAVNNLSNGITLGNSITVTLASMSAVNNVYTATELNDISSASAGNPGTNGTGTGTGLESDNTEGSSDGTDLYSGDTSGTDTYGTDTYGYDETYNSYDDGSSYSYDDGSGDYYYYDPATEYYDESYSY